NGIPIPFCFPRYFSRWKLDEFPSIALERPNCNIDRQFELAAPLQVTVVGSLVYHPVVFALTLPVNKRDLSAVLQDFTVRFVLARFPYPFVSSILPEGDGSESILSEHFIAHLGSPVREFVAFQEFPFALDGAKVEFLQEFPPSHWDPWDKCVLTRVASS